MIVRLGNTICSCAIVGDLALAPSTAQSQFILGSDDFEASIDPARWNSSEYPSPVFASGGNAVGNYSLNLNGHGYYMSGAVSADTFALPRDIRVTIDAYIQSAAQLTFGFARTTNIGLTPNPNLFSVATVTIDADTQESGYNFYTRFDGDSGVEVDYPSEVSGLTSASVFDGWHTYVFDFPTDESAQVLVDDARAFETDRGLYDYSIDSGFTVALGGRSYGATVNIYDSIQVSQAPELSACGLLLIGNLTLLLSRSRPLKLVQFNRRPSFDGLS